ncbi:MAG: ATP-binding protein [Paraglaciecola sp.]|uniref:hybrid sensor histidine kinase/response regulator n=1 Tax=Paraglaciecola sp. TaxID=1920173 RepID=UPI0032977838
MFRTIKSQMLLVLTILVTLMLSQVFLSRNIQSTFIKGLDVTQKMAVKASLVRELERDVIDLQRNVLIYKNLANDTSIKHFNILMTKSLANLNSIADLTAKEENRKTYLDYIKRMRAHLNNYQENFNSVIVGRTKRNQLYEEGVLNNLESAFEGFNFITQSTQMNERNYQSAKFHLAQAETLLLQYLLAPDQSIVEPFNQLISAVKNDIKLINTDVNQIQSALQTLSNVETEFSRLTQITRGYLFIANVVMTGSANEFLMLARDLNNLVTESLKATNRSVKKSIDTSRLSSIVFSLLGSILAIVTTLFLIYKIMLPVNTITKIFRMLAKDKSIESIPGLKRTDEIGELAQAANVFHKKNKQTTALLEQSQRLNEQQELLNQELIEINRKAEHATASKSMFLANMSHEIRTPINGIIGLIEVLKRSSLSAEQMDKLTKVSYSGQILLHLIDSILDFSKIEAGRLDIENIEFNANTMFSNILANIESSAQHKKLNIRIYINPDLPNILIGDPLRIAQILLNLCSNAVKFTRHGSVLINIDFSYKNDSDIKVIIDVKDTGIGMLQKQVDRVFDKFSQADGSTSREFGGTGLGLSIVKQLVELMSGHINVRSEKGVGSTFTVALPLKTTAHREQVLSKAPNKKAKLYYFSISRQSFLHHSYLDKLGIDYHHLPITQLTSMVDEIKKGDIVVLDVDEKSALKSFFEAIDYLHNRYINVGFVSHSHSKNLSDQIKQFWDVEFLYHPFVPEQCSQFLMTLFCHRKVVSFPKMLERQREATTQYSGHVLIVEDNEINLAVTCEMLTSMGIHYDIAHDGNQAVSEVLKSRHYDMIFMDIQMPLMDGYEATRKIRELGYKDLIICGLSANAMQQDYDKANSAGMNDYLTKPINHVTLENMIAKYLSVNT